MEKRIMRITWNENHWEKPSGHKWKKENQGKVNIAYENQFGFGHEEWLFNPRYRIGEFQYGMIQGVNGAKLKKEIIDELYLYTKSPKGKIYLLGRLKNVQRLKKLRKEELELFAKYHKETVLELIECNADYSILKDNNLTPILKFNIEEAIIFEEPKIFNFNISKYKRYQPYKLNELDEYSLKDYFINNTNLLFVEGKSDKIENYSKVTTSKRNEINSLHVPMLNNIYDFLKQNYPNNKFSKEKSSIYGKIIDLLELTENKSYNFYEIKTHKSGLSNIREALGQILEYALIDTKIKVNKLIIVGPVKLNFVEEEYLHQLKNVIKINLEYWFYDIDKNNIVKY